VLSENPAALGEPCAADISAGSLGAIQVELIEELLGDALDPRIVGLLIGTLEAVDLSNDRVQIEACNWIEIG